MKNIYYIFLAIVLGSCHSEAQMITLQDFSSGYTSPVDIANCGDSRLFIVQQNGSIYICDSLGVKANTPFLNIASKISTGGERGLLGLAFHPDYANNGYFFVNYTKVSSGATVIERYSRDANNPNIANPNSGMVILEFAQPYSNHNGGCLKFGADGYLYIGTGDGGSGGDPNGYGQNTQTFLGKMLRLDVDNGSPYAIPPSNPFVGSTSTKEEIWAIGMRNPWRFSFDRLTHDLWIADVGQNLWEEIDFEPANSSGGLNYGWRCYEATHTYSTNGCQSANNYVMPIFEYAHSTANGCSVTGGFVYRGALYNDLYGKYLFADYCSGRYWLITKNADGSFANSVVATLSAYQYAAFGENNQGDLFVTGISSGKIYKIKSSNCSPVAIINSADSVQICNGSTITLSTPYNPALTYAWLKDGAPIGNDSPTLTVDAAGNYSVMVSNIAAGTNCVSTAAPVNISISTVEVPTMDGAQVICQDGVAVYSVPAVTGASYNWNVVGGAIIAGQGTNQITVQWSNGATGQVSLTQTQN